MDKILRHTFVIEKVKTKNLQKIERKKDNNAAENGPKSDETVNLQMIVKQNLKRKSHERKSPKADKIKDKTVEQARLRADINTLLCL